MSEAVAEARTPFGASGGDGLPSWYLRKHMKKKVKNIRQLGIRINRTLIEVKHDRR